MFVCEKCHEKDKNVTKCTKPLKDHGGFTQSWCDICGKTARKVFFCWYGEMEKQMADVINNVLTE